MTHLRDLFNEIKWTKDIRLVEIWIIHRGAPGDKKRIKGKDIGDIHKSSFDVGSSSIPFHRVLTVVYDGDIIFQRQ